MAASILCKGLTKFYGTSKIAALTNLTLTIEPGEVYGFLGANGAGKSTTIRLLLNFLQPTSGRAVILGQDVSRNPLKARQHVGYLAGEVALYQKETGRNLLNYLSTLQPATSYRQTLEKRFQADLDKPIVELSKGNRQKIGIIQAFMHRPKVLILDEPTSGLDPLMQEAFYETLYESRSRGSAILMSSHNLAEAQRICDRVGIIKLGKLIREQPINQLNNLALPVFKVRFDKQIDLATFRSNAGLTVLSQIDAHTVLLKPSAEIAGALQQLSTYQIAEFSTQTADLEDEFLEFYGAES